MVYQLINSTNISGVEGLLYATENGFAYTKDCITINNYEPMNIIFYVFYFTFMIIIILQKNEIKKLKND